MAEKKSKTKANTENKKSNTAKNKTNSNQKKNSSTIGKAKKKNNIASSRKIEPISDVEPMSHSIIIILVVLIIFGLVYLLTVQITKKDTEKEVEEGVTISYEKILAGSSFSMRDGEYIVVYYHMSTKEDDDLYDDMQEISTQISTYLGNHSEAYLYQVDLGSSLNKSVISATDEVNTSPNSASELKMKNPTLIKFNEKKVVEYIQGKDEIIQYLSN